MQAIALRLTRALLPSWRFFDEIEPAPQLQVRRLRGDDAGAWCPVEFVPPRKGWGLVTSALLWNARGNLGLAEHALLEQLLDDLNALRDARTDVIEKLPAYALVGGLAARQARALEPDGKQFQFRLLQAEHVDAEPAQLLLSPVYALP